MDLSLIFFVKLLLLIPFLVAAYFLIVTRGSLVIQPLYKRGQSDSHIYWIYTNRFLICLTDRPLIISAILLFNYNRLVEATIASLNPSLKGKSVLQVSCAFGNISQRVVKRCAEEGARRVVIGDLIPNEIKHTRKKLAGISRGGTTLLLLEDAVSLAHKDDSFDYVVLFFLFHELPLKKKVAARVVKGGGRIVFCEFHRPASPSLTISGNLFFKIFEPYAEEMWGAFDPKQVLNGEAPGRWRFTRTTYFLGNYQHFSATKLPPSPGTTA